MNKLYIFLVLLLFTDFSFAQTGPGGVGNSSANIFWFDANKGVSTTGPNVTAWADQSGNGLTASPPAANARPTLVTSSVNGYPSIDFDGTNDQLHVADAALIDLTTWHFFIVPIVDGAKDYNAWLTKGVDGNENYELLSYSTNNIHAPIYWSDGTRTFPSAGNNQLNTSTFEIIEYSYTSSVGRDLYRNYTSIYTDNESKTPSTNAHPLYIGNENGTSRFIDGDLAEVIGFNIVLNSAQRIIVNNYLAAKYNRTLGSNDLYTMDNAGNGNFDHDVAGIGRVNASNIHDDSQGSGIIRINNPRGLGNNEFLFWGHDNAATISTYTTDVPTGVSSRMARVWRASETGEVGNVDISIDLTGLGSVTASDLRLFIDTDNDGVFTDETAISGATALGGNVYQWTNVDIDNNQRFSFGTINNSTTPLPVELISFYAQQVKNDVQLNWTTATEKNNRRFELEKSINGIDFKLLSSHNSLAPGGNSLSELNYSATDPEPTAGSTYYRLKQTDNDGSYKYSSVITFSYEKENNVRFVVFPNPNKGEFFVDFSGIENEHEVSIEIRDLKGKTIYSHEFVSQSEITNTVEIIPNERPERGEYLVVFYFEGIQRTAKIVVQ